jgi:putative inorganic carbon (HCO3(-)) transporter
MCICNILSKYYETSVFRKIVDFFDITEDSVILKASKESFVVQKINSLLTFSQNLFVNFSETSVFVKNIDNLLLLLLGLMMLSILFASTGIIGGLAFLSFALLVIRALIKKGESFSVNSLDPAIFLYIAIAAISVTYSYLPFGAIKGFAKMLVYFGVYLTFFNIIKDHPKRSLYLLGGLAAIASIEAFYAVYQQIHGVAPLASWQDMSKANPEQVMNRVYGTLKPFNPNLLAGFLIASLSSTFGAFFIFLTKKNYKLAVISGIGALAVLLSVIFTGSRGAYISLAGMMTILMAISGHIIWRDYSENKLLKQIWLGIIIGGISLVILAIIASPALQHRILSIFAARGDSSNSFRMNVWISTFKMFMDNWLIGIGPGNTVFRLTYGFYMVTGFDALGAYCVPLEIAAESGIFALLAFVWLLVMIAIKSVKTIVSQTNIEQKIVISTCLIGITGIMLHGLVDTVFFRPQINIIFWMLIAVFAANLPKSTES